MKYFPMICLALFCAMSLSAQTDIRLAGHSLGETAETFFSTAMASESKQLTSDYCNKLLNDAEAMRRYEASKNGLNKKDFLLSDVGGCQSVMAAIRGERAVVGARLASELGKGHVLFVSGKLTSFSLFSESSYADAVAAMKKRLGVKGRKYEAPQVSEGVRWDVAGITAMVWKMKYSDKVCIDLGYTGVD